MCPDQTLAGGLSRRYRARIALAAYKIWEQEGRPQGRILDHWRIAEDLVRRSLEKFQYKATFNTA
ncbi:MAG TPA: DUF2934 domain-containing protein [Phycisphaerae bacterium]|nr:DUF2934 domain-containing protein [Phycisphaerae bacterium]